MILKSSIATADNLYNSITLQLDRFFYSYFLTRRCLVSDDTYEHTISHFFANYARSVDEKDHEILKSILESNDIIARKISRGMIDKTAKDRFIAYYSNRRAEIHEKMEKIKIN